jgi:hypothetical protein
VIVCCAGTAVQLVWDFLVNVSDQLPVTGSLLHADASGIDPPDPPDPEESSPHAGAAAQIANNTKHLRIVTSTHEAHVGMIK